MSQKRPRYRHSWKKPWAFDNVSEMRRTLDEREVYKKLKVLERHSSFKKPYLNWKGSHRTGELFYSWPGFPARNPNPGGGSDVIPPNPGPGGCQMACLGGIIDCRDGGCDNITCICGEPFYVVQILEDPSGQAWVEEGINPRLCIPPNLKLENEYNEIIAVVRDSKGQQSVVRFPLVDCARCCDAFSLTGASTQNPGTTWAGTIDPACEDATIAAESNSGCTFSASVVDNGATANVVIGDSDCGTVTVTVTSPVDAECNTEEAEFVFTINDTGQGGDWIYLSSGASGCTDCNQCFVDNQMVPCVSGEFKYGKESAGTPLAEGKCDSNGYNSCCWSNEWAGPGQGCDAADGNPPPCNAPSCGNCSGQAPPPDTEHTIDCCSFMWRKCEWKCSC